MGALTQTSECIPIGSDPECTKIPSHKAPPPEKQQFCKKNKKKSPGGIELTTTRRPQQITMGSGTMGLAVLLKEPPISPTS